MALHEKGIVERSRFQEIIHTLISEHTSKLPSQGILVTLTPRQGLSPEECAAQFEPQRSGDIGCVAGSDVLIFLFGCHPSKLKLALTRNFLVDPSELFETIYTKSDDLSILATLRMLEINTAASEKKELIENKALAFSDQPEERVHIKSSRKEVGPNPIEPQALDNNFLEY